MATISLNVGNGKAFRIRVVTSSTLRREPWSYSTWSCTWLPGIAVLSKARRDGYNLEANGIFPFFVKEGGKKNLKEKPFPKGTEMFILQSEKVVLRGVSFLFIYSFVL